MYGFFSEKQAAVGGFAVFRLADGTIAKVSESTISSDSPSGYWDDYVHLGELGEFIDSNISVAAAQDLLNAPPTERTPTMRDKEESIIEYLEAPEEMVKIIVSKMDTKNIDAARLVLAKAYVCLHLFGSGLPADRLYACLGKLGMTPQQVAREIVSQKQSRSKPFSVS